MLTQTLAAFLVTATVLTMAPGLDTAIVLRSSTADGIRHGVATALGIAIGCLCWGAAAAFGLSALLGAFPRAFDLLRLVGAVYLGWLGAKLLLQPRPALAGAHTPAGDASIAVAMRRGFLTNILNPKVGAFYLTLLPQFVPAQSIGGGHAFLLAAMHVGIAVIWFSLLASATGMIRPWLRRPGVLPTLDRITGGILVLLGLQMIHVVVLHA